MHVAGSKAGSISIKPDTLLACGDNTVAAVTVAAVIGICFVLQVASVYLRNISLLLPAAPVAQAMTASATMMRLTLNMAVQAPAPATCIAGSANIAS